MKGIERSMLKTKNTDLKNLLKTNIIGKNYKRIPKRDF